MPQCSTYEAHFAKVARQRRVRAHATESTHRHLRACACSHAARTPGRDSYRDGLLRHCWTTGVKVGHLRRARKINAALHVCTTHVVLVEAYQRRQQARAIAITSHPTSPSSTPVSDTYMVSGGTTLQSNAVHPDTDDVGGGHGCHDDVCANTAHAQPRVRASCRHTDCAPPRRRDCRR
jgi:hypothetical protein